MNLSQTVSNNIIGIYVILREFIQTEKDIKFGHVVKLGVESGVFFGVEFGVIFGVDFGVIFGVIFGVDFKFNIALIIYINNNTKQTQKKE